MANADPVARDQCFLDWGAIQDTCHARLSTQRNASALTAWQTWSTFCSSLGVQPYRPPDTDYIPLLQLFAQRYRDGTIAPGRQPVRSRTVEEALRAVGQAHARLGSADPRLNALGKVEFRLASLLQAWKKLTLLLIASDRSPCRWWPKCGPSTKGNRRPLPRPPLLV